jgi:hypothetical protein
MTTYTLPTEVASTAIEIGLCCRLVLSLKPMDGGSHLQRHLPPFPSLEAADMISGAIWAESFSRNAYCILCSFQMDCFEQWTKTACLICVTMHNDIHLFATSEPYARNSTEPLLFISLPGIFGVVCFKSSRTQPPSPPCFSRLRFLL